MAVIQGGHIIEGSEPAMPIVWNAGAPDGTTLAGSAAPGTLLIDTTNANLYINAGTKAAPVWKLFARAA